MHNPAPCHATRRITGRDYRPEIAEKSLSRQRLLQTVVEIDTVKFTNSAVATL